MADWREKILNKFSKTYLPLTIVSDPDGLLQDVEINRKLREQGYEIHYYSDEPSFTRDKYTFRYHYESYYRSRWDRGEQYKLLLVFGVPEKKLTTLVPYDIWTRGKKHFFSIYDIFPMLSYPVISELRSVEIDRLYKSYQQFKGRKLGEKATKKFVLARVYKADPEVILALEDLISTLMQLHYSNTVIPPPFRSYLIEQLLMNPEFNSLPLEDLFSAQPFFTFIQGQWKQFVKDIEENSTSSVVAFEHPLIKPFISNLFTEGQLSAVQASKPAKLPVWMHIGIKNTPMQSDEPLLERILEELEASILGPKPLPKDWQHLSMIWAEAIVQKINIGSKMSGEVKDRFEKLHLRIEEKFADWIIKNHPALYTLHCRSPVIVSKIGDYLLSKIKDKDRRIALLIIDGLSLDQWIVLKKCIEDENPGLFEFDTKTMFAAVPTLTSVSRQAIFSAKAPSHFGDTLLNTNVEEKQWQQFWDNANLRAAYKRGLMLNNNEEIMMCSTLFDQQVVGLVISFVDKTMHGATLGTASMHDAIKRWIKNGVAVKLLEELSARDFEIYVTSDHGNIEACGIGTLSQGSLVEQAGTRVRIYKNIGFAKQAQQKHPESILWSEDPRARYYFLFALGCTAFSKRSTMKVSHGGISLEEVVVPFVNVRKRK